MSIITPSVTDSSAALQTSTTSALSSGAVSGSHHHHHGSGSDSQFSPLLAELTEANETPTSGADSSVLTASAGTWTDPILAAMIGSSISSTSSTDPSASLLGALTSSTSATDQSSTTDSDQNTLNTFVADLGSDTGIL